MKGRGKKKVRKKVWKKKTKRRKKMRKRRRRGWYSMEEGKYGGGGIGKYEETGIGSKRGAVDWCDSGGGGSL